ncbi:hypothetical protein AB0I22_28825 [Streptomyces sp. NPDC050610]|uniref:hypothetical protein n=1 Tax=Streptomyces sp. NPDC050610 TaxID=3157097 RepID=UPI003447F3BE
MSADQLTSPDTATPAERTGSVALCMGIVSCALLGLLLVVPWYRVIPLVFVAPLVGIGAIVAGANGLYRVRRGGAVGGGMAQAGVTLGILAIVTSASLVCWGLSLLDQSFKTQATPVTAPLSLSSSPSKTALVGESGHTWQPATEPGPVA